MQAEGLIRKIMSDKLTSGRTTALLLMAAALIVASIIVAPFYLSRKTIGPDGKAVSRPVATHDINQHLAVMSQFDVGLRSGSIYPRWQPDLNNGYGLPWTNYYPPGFYYLTSLVNPLFNNWFHTLFALLILGLAASGLTFYLLSRLFYDRWASATGALLYMVFPYHTLDLYWRGAMPELQGFIFVPLVLYFAFKVGAEAKIRHYAGLGLFYGLYLVTHFPVAYLFSYTLALYGLIWAWRARDWRIALRIALGMALGLMTGAIYLVPALLEYKDTHEPFSTVFPYHNSYITLLPDKGFGNMMNLSFAAQAAALVVALFILYRFLRARKETEVPAEAPRQESMTVSQTRIWIILGVFTTFMSTSFSYYLSRLIPRIESVSFAWRWLVITGFFSALLFAAAIHWVRNHARPEGVQKWVYRIAIGLVLILNIWITSKSIIGDALLHGPLDTPANHIEEGFIPKGGSSPRQIPDTPLTVTLPEGAATEVVRWEPLYREIGVNATGPTELRLKTYNFPGWVARVDGRETPIGMDKDGAQLIALEPGRHRVQVSFVSTPPRTAGSALTIFAFVIILGLFGFDYYRRGRLEIEDREKPAT